MKNLAKHLLYLLLVVILTCNELLLRLNSNLVSKHKGLHEELFGEEP